MCRMKIKLRSRSISASDEVRLCFFDVRLKRVTHIGKHLFQNRGHVGEVTCPLDQAGICRLRVLAKLSSKSPMRSGQS